jgi:transposase
MKKSSKSSWREEEGLVIGVDLGDKYSSVCVRGAEGELRQEDRVRTNSMELSRFFTGMKPALVVMEVGTHSPWVQRLLTTLGHQVVVANPRRLKMISESDVKSDRVDAALLSELGQCMPRLLNPVRHRSAEAQADLAVIRARARLVEVRTKLWNALRSMAKSMGSRLPRKVRAEHVEAWEQSLKPLWEIIEAVTEKIKGYDKEIERLAQTKYPEAIRLQQVAGVGPLISLSFVLTIDDPRRFRKSRQVGSYLGLRRKQQDSGESQPQLRITRAGDRYLRQLLVQGAQYILGAHGPDTDLRRWGKRLEDRGGRYAKQRAAVAVARKLAVLMHQLWVSGAGYEPVRQSTAVLTAAAV